MKPFITEGLPQFPDYPKLQALFPAVDAETPVYSGLYYMHPAADYPVVRDFIARFEVPPYAAFVSKFIAGAELQIHKDSRSTVKLHCPIEAEDCTISFYSPEPHVVIASHRYARECPVLMDVQVPHSLFNPSKRAKYSLIFSWDSLDLESAARMLAKARDSVRARSD